jgi:hypothetical protein
MQRRFEELWDTHRLRVPPPHQDKVRGSAGISLHLPYVKRPFYSDYLSKNFRYVYHIGIYIYAP